MTLLGTFLIVLGCIVAAPDVIDWLQDKGN
jgi:hypothetical protein